MNNINSLYEFIKEQKEKKNKPLKIICDWDDCIQPFDPWIIFQVSPDKDNLDKFEDYFQAYFNKDAAKNKEAAEFVEKVKKEKLTGSYYDQLIDKHGCNWKYEVTPFTTIAEDLLKALKEDLIDELLIISSYAYWYEGGSRPSSAPRILKMLKSKTKKVLESFGKSTNCTFEHTEMSRDKATKKLIPERFERIKMLCPEFDIFIDDREKQITETAKHFSSDKSYVLPAYDNCNSTQAPNIYRVKTSISNIKDSDFVFKKDFKKKQNEEEKELALQKLQKKREGEKKIYWMIGIVMSILILVALLIVARKKGKVNGSKRKQRKH
jgi:hypothetical protein